MDIRTLSGKKVAEVSCASKDRLIISIKKGSEKVYLKIMCDEVTRQIYLITYY